MFCADHIWKTFHYVTTNQKKIPVTHYMSAHFTQIFVLLHFYHTSLLVIVLQCMSDELIRNHVQQKISGRRWRSYDQQLIVRLITYSISCATYSFPINPTWIDNFHITVSSHFAVNSSFVLFLRDISTNQIRSAKWIWPIFWLTLFRCRN